jgi:hypothetical protein
VDPDPDLESGPRVNKKKKIKKCCFRKHFFHFISEKYKVTTSTGSGYGYAFK